MGSYGRQTFGQVGFPLSVAADLEDVDWKAGGITLDWSTVAAVSGSDVTWNDGNVVKVGAKALRYGQILTKITQAEQQTVTVANATGGTFTLDGVNPQTGAVGPTAALAYNVSAADMKTALEGIFGTGKVTVSLSTGVYTVTFSPTLGNVAQLTATDSTTGSGHAVTPATVSQGVASAGKFGPYDPAATDGRQTLTRGECFILNQSVYELDPLGGAISPVASDHPAVFDGGLAWKARILMTTGTHSLAAGPTVTEFEAAFPDVNYVEN